MRQPGRGSVAALGLLSLGLVGVVAIVLVVQESTRYADTHQEGLSVQQLRSRVLREPGLQAQLWHLARRAESAEAFAVLLQQSGLVLGHSGATAGSGATKYGGTSGEHSAGSSTSGTTSSGSGISSSSGSSARNPTQPRPGVPPPLSREVALAHAQDNIIIVTWANFEFHDFALNWARNLRQQGIRNFLVGAMDMLTAQALMLQDVPVFAMFDVETETSSGLTTGDFGWGSPTFHKMGRQKVDLARRFTSFGLDLCLCDVDTVWINDPTSYFERYPDADILASSDQLHPTLRPSDTGLENPQAIHSALNIGLLYFRHSANTTRFLEGWAHSLEADDKVWDQNAFNWLVHEGLLPFESHPADERLVWAYNHSVVLGILPVASFASGHTFFVQKLFQVLEVQPYVVHTTFQYGGTKGKRNRLREAMLWVDDPSYYEEGKFLSVELETPKVPEDFDSWEDEKMQNYHLEGMRMQLQQMRAAFGLAVALNRTIIMPKMLCFCDRYWGPVERCRVPGATATRLPFVCPMDHVFEPFHFDNDPSTKGPPIAFREYSWLDNSHVPQALKDSKVVVSCQKGLDEPKREGNEVVVPTGGTDFHLKAWLSPFKNTQLLHVTLLNSIWGGFRSVAERKEFRGRISSMAGFWCCKAVEPGQDGGVPYVQLMMPD